MIFYPLIIRPAAPRIDYFISSETRTVFFCYQWGCCWAWRSKKAQLFGRLNGWGVSWMVISMLEKEGPKVGPKVMSLSWFSSSSKNPPQIIQLLFSESNQLWKFPMKIPWNPMTLGGISMKSHEIPWNLPEHRPGVAPFLRHSGRGRRRRGRGRVASLVGRRLGELWGLVGRAAAAAAAGAGRVEWVKHGGFSHRYSWDMVGICLRYQEYNSKWRILLISLGRAWNIKI